MEPYAFARLTNILVLVLLYVHLLTPETRLQLGFSYEAGQVSRARSLGVIVLIHRRSKHAFISLLIHMFLTALAKRMWVAKCELSIHADTHACQLNVDMPSLVCDGYWSG